LPEAGNTYQNSKLKETYHERLNIPTIFIYNSPTYNSWDLWLAWYLHIITIYILLSTRNHLCI